MNEAPRHVLALGGQAPVGARAHLVPGRELIRKPGDLRTIAALGARGPLKQAAKKNRFAPVVKARLIDEIAEPTPAEVIASPFEA